MNLILLGAPGSGKGTQAEHLEKEFGLTHIATGDLFRYNLKNRTELGVLAEQYMQSGQLVPDEVTVAMVRQRMQQGDIANGVLFDGFPRTIPQALALDELLKEFDTRIHGVIYLRVPDDEIITRLSGRLICRECQAPFHSVYNPFKTCPYDKCQGEHLYQRDDDKAETVQKRLQTYHAQTAPLVDHYTAMNLLHEVPGVGAIDEITDSILETARKMSG